MRSPPFPALPCSILTELPTNTENMKSESTTEAEMRAEKAPWPETVEALTEYITSLVERKHDYGTCVYAMSLAATAAFQHVASKLGGTAFQASCADLDILRRTRSMDGPFIILKAEDMCYPQYDLTEKLREAMDGWKEWVAEECAKKLEKSCGDAHPDVKAHWERLASHKSNAELCGPSRERQPETPDQP